VNDEIPLIDVGAAMKPVEDAMDQFLRAVLANKKTFTRAVVAKALAEHEAGGTGRDAVQYQAYYGAADHVLLMFKRFGIRLSVESTPGSLTYLDV
jgi:hypothetical protein